MKHNKQQSHYVLDFSDIEDISDNESESSKQSNQHQQINQSTPIPNRIELQIPNLQVKKETVEIPSILIQEEEEPVIRRKQDVQKQQWQVNFDELSEHEQQESDMSEVAIEIQKDPSPPTIVVEEPQYIEQYFEDQNVIEEIDIEQEQLKLEQRKQQLKQDMITKKQQQQQQQQIPKVQQVQKEQQRVQEIVTSQTIKNVENKTKQRYKQKFYNPKNSLIYLRLKGREDLYKKQELIIDEQTKPVEQDEYLEGLECINNLLIGLSKIKDKKVGAVEKQKILPLQIQRHRLDEKGVHHKETKIQKKDEKDKEIEQQKKNQNVVQNDEKQTELALKQQQLQEAQLARQIRHEKQLQEKEKQKLLEQRQVYKILTKKQINQGLILYRCQLRQKQKDSIKWLRYSEIALISKGESEIFNFEKRISDQLFMQLHKANMRSVLITKQAMFDINTIHYVKELKQVDEIEQKEVAQLINNEIENPNVSINEQKQVKEKKVIRHTDRKKKVSDNQKNGDSEKQQSQKEKQQLQDQIQQQDKQVIQQSHDNQQQKDKGHQQETKRTKNKVTYLESDEEKKDEDLLDADSIQIFKITQKKLDKKDKDLKQQQNNQQQYEESKQIESNELGQKDNNNNNNNNNNQQIKEQKKVKNPKIKECPLSRLETNDEIKKKEQINQKRKEKRRQEYQQYLNEIEQEQLNEIALSKQKKAFKDSQNQETNKQQVKQTNNNKSKKRSNKQENENIEDQIIVKDSNTTKQIVNTRQNKSSSSKSSSKRESIEPGYISSKRIYENRDQKKKRLRVIEDDESEFCEQNAKQNEKKQKKKRVRSK